MIPSPLTPPPGLPPPPMSPGPDQGMAPPMPPMGMTPPPAAPPEPNLGDPMQLLDALKQLAGQTTALPPSYPRGFVKPPKPKIAQITMDARKLWDANTLWRALIHEIQRWTRQDISGSFDEDEEDREQGFQEAFIGTALSDERNLAIAKLSTLKGAYLKRARNEGKEDAEKIEQACHHIRREFEYLHARDGNRPLSIDEASMVVDTGMLCTRLTFDDANPEFPLCRKVVDSTEVYPVYGSPSGLKAVYRVHRTTLLRLFETYGYLMSAAQMANLKKSFNSDNVGATTEVQVYEYWDEWWRAVVVNEIEIVSVTAHEYGRVPWRIQYTGMGEAMFTRTPLGVALNQLSTALAGSATSLQTDRVYKAVPFVFYRIRSHDMYESIMARLITGIKKAINPPMLRARSNEAAEKPMLPLDTSPGAQNELMRGEEDMSPIPTTDASQATSLVLAALSSDKETGGMPRSAFGVLQGASNVTGVAQQMGVDTALDKLAPLIQSFQFGEAQEMELALSLIRNFGDDAKYGGSDQVTPLIVPARKKNQQAFELDQELIDRTGMRVEVTYTQIDESKWLPIIQAANLGVPLGVIKREEVRVLLTGEHDWETHFQEWIDEQALVNATQLPEFAKSVTVPHAFLQEIAAASGDPQTQAMLQDQLKHWLDVTKPAPPQPPPGQAGPPGLPPGPPQGYDAGQGQAPPIVNTQGLSLPGMGAGPGSAGNVVGRPQLSGQNVGP